MCFYDRHRFACGDWKWGQFRQMCGRDYSITGDTCPIKLVMQTYPLQEKCKFCENIDTKRRRRSQAQHRILQLSREGIKYRASIDKAQAIIASLCQDIYDLECERQWTAPTNGEGGGLIAAVGANS